MTCSPWIPQTSTEKNEGELVCLHQHTYKMRKCAFVVWVHPWRSVLNDSEPNRKYGPLLLSGNRRSSPTWQMGTCRTALCSNREREQEKGQRQQSMKAQDVTNSAHEAWLTEGRVMDQVLFGVVNFQSLYRCFIFDSFHKSITVDTIRLLKWRNTSSMLK